VKITLDTTILVRAFDSSGALAQRLLLLLLEGNHNLVLSSEILAEIKSAPLSQDASPDPTLYSPIRDPNDAVVLQTAIVGGADVVCATDEDFFHSPATEFLQSANILVLTDADAAPALLN
jgi:predicted nucleic acid-binding protein